MRQSQMSNKTATVFMMMMMMMIKNISRVSVARRGRYELIQVTCAEIILSHL